MKVWTGNDFRDTEETPEFWTAERVLDLFCYIHSTFPAVAQAVTVRHVARMAGIDHSPVCRWRKLYTGNTGAMEYNEAALYLVWKELSREVGPKKATQLTHLQ